MNKYFLSAIFFVCAVFLLASASFADTAASGDASQTMKRLDQNQEKILQALEEIKSELQIIKVRVSSR